MANKVFLQKTVTFMFVVFCALMFAMYDVFAYLNDARATVSQVWLSVNRKYGFPVYVSAILMGILQQHVSVARDPKHGIDPPFFPQALFATAMFLVGLWLTHVIPFLSQRPTVD